MIVCYHRLKTHLLGLNVGNDIAGARERILDAAEELFAYKGINGVSIRQITTKAEVRLASVNYYFKSKEGLFIAVLLRRVNVLKDQRMTLLGKIDIDNLSAQEALLRYVHAFIYPLLERTLEGGVGWRNYCRLVAMAAAMQVDKPSDLERKPFDDVSLVFIKTLQKILPNISERNSFYAYQFMVGSTQYIFVQGQRMDLLSKGKYLSSELDKICDELIAFIASGIKALEGD